MYRGGQLAQMSVAMMLYTFVAIIIEKVVALMNVK